jgi:polysaccharide export outer membrane protein
MTAWKIKKITLCFALGTLPLLAQVYSRPVVDTPIAATSSTTSLPDHAIVPNDLLSVSVFDEPEASRPSVRVGTDGTIVMPLLKDKLKVDGLQPLELADEISRRLVAEQILVHPLVSVAILEYASRMISVVGAVKIPGQFNITGPIPLLEALAKAGWTTNEAGSELTFATSAKDAPRKINIDQLTNASTDSSVNLTLTGGEVINVLEAPKIWVTGNVAKPQAVPVRKPGDATVLKVVASVEGLTQYYAKVAYIYRADPLDGGKRKEIPVPLKEIMHRKKQDVSLVADDILLIPDDGGYVRRQILNELQTLSGGAASASIVFGLQHP